MGLQGDEPNTFGCSLQLTEPLLILASTRFSNPTNAMTFPESVFHSARKSSKSGLGENATQKAESFSLHHMPTFVCAATPGSTHLASHVARPEGSEG